MKKMIKASYLNANYRLYVKYLKGDETAIRQAYIYGDTLEDCIKILLKHMTLGVKPQDVDDYGVEKVLQSIEMNNGHEGYAIDTLEDLNTREIYISEDVEVHMAVETWTE